MEIRLGNPKEKDLVRVEISETGESETVREKGARTLILGLGKKRSEVTERGFNLLPRQIISLAKNAKARAIAVPAIDFVFPQITKDEYEIGKRVACEMILASLEFTTMKTAPEKGWPEVKTVYLTGSVSKEFARGIKDGILIGAETNATRMLSNTPGGEMTPSLLANAARKAAKGTQVSVRVLGRTEMKKLGMGAILGVAQGSSEEPQFIVMEYLGLNPSKDGSPKGAGNPKTAKGGSDNRPIVLVGKGVTFDTGGLNLKPSDAMYEMHMDMSGGAAVIHSIVLAAKLGLKKNIIALVPAVENMPSGSSYRPGDILRSMSGKTIEILNTDAEGRVILADGLFYAGKKYNPRLVVDVATLTGAAMVAFGNRASAIFTADETLEKNLRDMGEASGDYVWPMPLWDEYENDIKGTFGDWANMGKGKFGGAIAGAMFLKQFTSEYSKDCAWVHIDIAPRMTATTDEFLARGAAGAPVRLLIELLRTY